MVDACVQCKAWRKGQYWNAFPDDKHHFFKVMVQNFREYLRIPQKFKSEFKGNISRKVTLLGPSGNKWITTLAQRGEDFVLQKGWPKFVEDHSIDYGDFLVFKYVQDSSFKVLIFDNTACEKEDSYFVEPGTESCCSSRNTIKPENSTTGEEEESDVKQTKERRQNSVVLIDQHQLKRQSKKRKNEKELMQEAKVEEEEETDSDEGESDVKQTKERRQQPVVSKHQLMRQSKRRKNEKELMQEAKDEEEEEETDSNSDSDKEFQPTTLGSKTRESKNDNRQSYSTYYESSRRPVTKKDIERAFHLASKHSTDRPSCKIKMKPSHVHHLFILTIPKEFADNCLPATNQEIKLQVGSKTWTVSFCRRNMQCTLNRGWAQFVLDNNLEIEDICVLELAQTRKTTLDVHIFRAVEEIIPLKVVKPFQ